MSLPGMDQTPGGNTERTAGQKAWDFVKGLADILLPDIDVTVKQAGIAPVAIPQPAMDPTVKYLVLALVALVGYKVLFDKGS